MRIEFLLFSMAKEGETALYPDCLVLFFPFFLPLLSPLFNNVWESLKQGSTMTYSHFFLFPNKTCPPPSFSSSFPAPWVLSVFHGSIQLFYLAIYFVTLGRKKHCIQRYFTDNFAYQNENGDEKFWKYLNCYPR